jgi:Tfp pilus assembly PilM family ATPase
VARFLDKHDVSGCRLAINLSGAQTLGRFFELPASKPDKFSSAVKFELKARIPLAEEDVVHDYHWTSIDQDHPASDSSEAPRRRVVLAAANRETVGLRLQPWMEAGASQLIVQSECIALANAVISNDGATADAQLSEGTLLVEIGAEATNFVTVVSGGIWFRGAYLGMRQFDAALATASRITNAEAEKLRRRPDRAALMHEADAHLQAEYRSFVEEFRRIVDQFDHETGVGPTRLLLCGGGSQHFGMLRDLRTGR